MQYRVQLFLAFLSSLVLLVLHLIALRFFLYWSISWFDALLHVIGGFAVGTTLLFLTRACKDCSPWITPIMGAFLVSIFWEILEYSIGTTFAANNLLIDTSGDVFLSVFGGVCAAFISNSIETFHEKS